MTHSSLHVTSVWILKVNFVVWAINALLFAVFVLSGSSLTGLLSSGFFSKLALFETGIALIVGGALAFSGSVSANKTKEYTRRSNEKWSIDKLRNSEKKANKYILLALLIFVESLVVSLFEV
jgi:predicted phage tail protein